MNMLDLYHLTRRAVEEAPKRSRRELSAFSTRARRDRILGQDLDNCSWEIWTRSSQMSTPEEVDAYIENIHTAYDFSTCNYLRLFGTEMFLVNGTDSDFETAEALLLHRLCQPGVWKTVRKQDIKILRP
jgi:hypothetical protein